MSESQSLSLLEEINSPYKALLMPLDDHTYNYATVLKLVVDEEPGVLARERKQVPWSRNADNSMWCCCVQTCQMCSFTRSCFLVV